LDKAGTIEEIAHILRDCGRELIGADGIALVLRDGDLCHYFEEDAIGPLWKGQKFPMGACISGWAMLKRQTVCIADIRMDKRIPYDLYENTFVRSLVMAPAEKNPPVAALGAYWSWAHGLRRRGRRRRSFGGSGWSGNRESAATSLRANGLSRQPRDRYRRTLNRLGTSAVRGVEKSSSLLQLCNQKSEPPIYDKTMKSFRRGRQLHVRFCLHQSFA
jgi:hypothetical protein